MMLSDLGGTEALWKKRTKALKGSRKLKDTFIAPVFSYSSTKPLRTQEVKVFHSIGSNSTSMPTSRRFSWINSFIGKGSIWPDPEVEIKKLVLTRLPSNPACFSSSLAFFTSEVYVKAGLPNQGCPG